MIRDSVLAFYLVATILVAIALLANRSTVIDAAAFAGVGLWLQRTLRKLPAMLLLLQSAGMVLATAYNQFIGTPGGRNLIVALIVFWAAIRAAVATYRLSAFQRPSARVGSHVGL